MNMARLATRWAVALMRRLGLSREDLLGMRFAINVGLASLIVWHALQAVGVTHPIWAIASMIAASDPEPGEARRMFRCRFINALVGGAAGLVFLLVGGMQTWVLPAALSTTVLISTYLVRIKTMWRQAPITAAIVIAGGIANGSASVGILHGLLKVGEVVFGCMVGLVVSVAMSKVWLIQKPIEEY